MGWGDFKKRNSLMAHGLCGMVWYVDYEASVL